MGPKLSLNLRWRTSSESLFFRSVPMSGGRVHVRRPAESRGVKERPPMSKSRTRGTDRLKGLEASPSPMTYRSSSESAACPSPVHVRSMMDMDGHAYAHIRASTHACTTILPTHVFLLVCTANSHTLQLGSCTDNADLGFGRESYVRVVSAQTAGRRQTDRQTDR